MRLLAVLTAAGLLSACATGPGLHPDEDHYAKATDESKDPNEPVLVPITPALVQEQAKALLKTQLSNNPDPLQAHVAAWDYRVRPYDVLSVIVWDHPELTIPAGEFRSAEATGHPVTSDGKMFYPHVGVVDVAGKTLGEIRSALTQQLARVIKAPQLDVRVVGFRSQKVQVTGQVVAPATLPITDVPMRALDAVSQVRGFAPDADPRNVVLTRDGKTYLLDLQALNERGDVSQNWLLQDGDILHVPDFSLNKVFVLGEVRRPLSRQMARGRMTLADAIGDSEGFDPLTSNPGRIYVIRGVMNRPTVYKLDASDPAALLLAVQFQLQPHDVVYVSAHNLTRWNRIVQQILPTVQGLWTLTQAADNLRSIGRSVIPSPVSPAPTPTPTP